MAKTMIQVDVQVMDAERRIRRLTAPLPPAAEVVHRHSERLDRRRPADASTEAV